MPKINIIESSATLIDEPDIKKKIELIGRTCYRSEDKICEGSDVKFVTNVVNKKHYSILEHVPLYLSLTGKMVDNYDDFRKTYDYIRRSLFKVPVPRMVQCVISDSRPLMHLATNARVIAELFDDIWEFAHLYDKEDEQLQFKRTIRNWHVGTEKSDCFIEALLHNVILSRKFQFLAIRKNISAEDWMEFVAPSSPYVPYSSYDLLISDASPIVVDVPEVKRDFTFYTIKFICDRGVSHEIVRHRNCAFMQESTRYCNYAEEANFIMPPFDEADKRYTVIRAYRDAVERYETLIDLGTAPELARAVLPNGLATTLIVTASANEWRHIFELRLLDKGGTAHPQIKEVMNKAYMLLFKHEVTSVLAEL